MSLLGSQHGKREEVLSFEGLLGGLNNSVDITKIASSELIDALNMHYSIETGKLRTRSGLTSRTTLPVQSLDSLFIGVASGSKRLVAASDNKLYEIRDDQELNEMVAEMILAGDTNESWAQNLVDNATLNNELTIVWSGSTAIRLEFLQQGYQCVADLSLWSKDGASDTHGTPILGFGTQKVGYNDDGAFLRHTNWGSRLQNESGGNYRFKYLSTYLEKGSAWTAADLTIAVWDSTLTTKLEEVTLLDVDIPPNGAPDWVTLEFDTIINIPEGEYFYITMISTVIKSLANDYAQLYVPFDGGTGIWSDVPAVRPIGYWDRNGFNTDPNDAFDADTGTFCNTLPLALPSSVQSEAIVPTGDLSNNFHSGGWEEVNEKGDRIDGNYMENNSTGNRRAEFAIEDISTFLPAGSSPSSISSTITIRSTGGQDETVGRGRIGIRISGTWYYSNWGYVHGQDSLGYGGAGASYGSNPDTGLPWVEADFATIERISVETEGYGSNPTYTEVHWARLYLHSTAQLQSDVPRITFGGDSNRVDRWGTEPPGPTVATMFVNASRVVAGDPGASYSVVLMDSLDNILDTFIADGNTDIAQQNFSVDVTAYLGDIADLRVTVLQSAHGLVGDVTVMRIHEVWVDFDQATAGWGPPTDGYGPVCSLTEYLGQLVGRDLLTGYPSDTQIRFMLRCSETDDPVVAGGECYVQFKTDDANYAEYKIQAGDLDETGYIPVSILRGGSGGEEGEWTDIVGVPNFRNITEILFHFENIPTGATSFMYIDYLHLYSAAADGAFEIGNLSGSLQATFANYLDVVGNETILVASGGILQYWSGSGGLQSVANAPNCSMVVVKSGRVFVNDIDEPDVVRGSGILDMTAWEYPFGVFAQAGWPDGDDVVGMHVVGDDLIIFKGTVHKKVVRLVGVYPEWSLKEIARGTSTMNHYAVATVGGTTFILDVDGINTLTGIDKYGEMQVSPISDVLGGGLVSRIDSTGFILKWPVNAAMLVKPSASDPRLFVMHYAISGEGETAIKWTPWEFEVPNISCGVYDYETDTIYLGTSDGNVYTLDASLYTDTGLPFSQLIKTKVLHEAGRELLLKEVILDLNEFSTASLEVLLLTDRGTVESVLGSYAILGRTDQVIRIKNRRRSRNLQLGLRVVGSGGIEVSDLVARIAIVGRD